MGQRGHLEVGRRTGLWVHGDEMGNLRERHFPSDADLKASHVHSPTSTKHLHPVARQVSRLLKPYLTMASEFIGYTILVTLSTPPNAQIQGVVSNVVDQKLHLHNGTKFEQCLVIR